MTKPRYKVRILYDVKGWAYYNRACALRKYAPADFYVDIGADYGRALNKRNYHLILQLAYSYVKPVREHLNKKQYKTKLMSSFNVGWGHNNKWLAGTVRQCDAVIVNNLEMWQKAGPLNNTYAISNGVDRDIFKYIVPIEKRPVKVLWCGSRFHKTVKGYEEFLMPVQAALNKLGIETDFRLTNSVGKGRLTSEQMADWYNTGCIYLCASKNEGTPNPALEAASCGCTIVSTAVGNMPELIEHGKNGYICERTVEDMVHRVCKAVKNRVQLSQNMQESIKPWHWAERSKQYFNLFRKIIDGK